MAYGQRPGNVEGFDYFAVFAIAILAFAAAQVTGAIDGLSGPLPQLDVRAELSSWVTGERRPATPEGVARRDRSHRVRRGETLAGIAARYRVPLAQLVAYAGIDDPARIEVGDVIRIPPREARLRRSETLAADRASGPGVSIPELLTRLLTGEPLADPAAPQMDAASVATAAPTTPAADPPSALDELLLMAEADLRAARFAEAAIAAQAALRFLDAHPETAGAERRRAEVEITLATIHTALGDPAAAERSFAAALRADPALTLDPADTSPKVLAGLEAARKQHPE
jgi:LysM repeat protein